MGRAICIFQIQIFLVKLLASLLLVKSEQEQQPRLINGRLYAYMESCPLPNVRLLGQTPSAAVVKIGESPPPPPASAAAAGHFQLELPSSGGNVQIEAECPSREAGANPSKSVYDLELAKIDWTGSNELLLFNDVHILAFGYPEQQQAIGLA